MNRDDIFLLLGAFCFSISMIINSFRISDLEKEIEQIKETNIVCEVEKDGN